MIDQLRALYKHWAHRPWQSWGGCSDPELSRYLMDYAFGWLDRPEAAPELAEKAYELKRALEEHLRQCPRCPENLRPWQTPVETWEPVPELVETTKG